MVERMHVNGFDDGRVRECEELEPSTPDTSGLAAGALDSFAYVIERLSGLHLIERLSWLSVVHEGPDSEPFIGDFLQRSDACRVFPGGIFLDSTR